MKLQKLNTLFVTTAFSVTMVFGPALASASNGASVGLGLGLSHEANANASVSVSSSADYSLPPGILHAPGIEKRIEDGKGLPPGLERKVSSPPPGSDTTTPVIERFVATSITASSAAVEVKSSERTKLQLFLTDKSPVVEADSVLYADANLSLNHRVALYSLKPDATYYVLVKVTDSSGNVTSSGELAFRTLVGPVDATSPVVSSIVLSSVATNSATIVVHTNEQVTADLYLSDATPLVVASSSVYSQTSLSSEHTFVLTGLVSNTSYYFVVRVQDSAGNATVAAEQTFKTEHGDITAPLILGPFAVSVEQTSARIVWFTLEASDSKVWFGTSSTINTSATANVAVDNDVFFHSVLITGLQASTTYNYVVGSADPSGNQALSAQGSFVTKL